VANKRPTSTTVRGISDLVGNDAKLHIGRTPETSEERRLFKQAKAKVTGYVCAKCLRHLDEDRNTLLLETDHIFGHVIHLDSVPRKDWEGTTPVGFFQRIREKINGFDAKRLICVRCHRIAHLEKDNFDTQEVFGLRPETVEELKIVLYFLSKEGPNLISGHRSNKDYVSKYFRLYSRNDTFRRRVDEALRQIRREIARRDYKTYIANHKI